MKTFIFLFLIYISFFNKNGFTADNAEAQAYFSKAVLFEQSDPIQADSAIYYFTLALNIEENRSAYMHRGYLFFLTNFKEEAFYDLSQVLKINPELHDADQCDALQYRGQLLFNNRLKAAACAINDYEMWLQYAPLNSVPQDHIKWVEKLLLEAKNYLYRNRLSTAGECDEGQLTALFNIKRGVHPSLMYRKSL